MENRLNWVDYSKGLGILFVVYVHVMRGLHDGNLGLSNSFFHISDTVFVSFTMPLFFLLSGLFAAKWVKRDFKPAFKQKMQFVFYPYFLWSIMQGFMIIKLSSLTNNKLTWFELTKIFYDPIAQFWFLYVLFFIFALYYFLSKVLSLKQLFILSVFLYFAAPFCPLIIFGKLMSNLIFFISGIILISLKDLDNRFEIIGKLPILGLSLLIFIVVSYFNTIFNRDFDFIHTNFLTLLTAFSGINLILSLSAFLSKRKSLKTIEYLGILSLIIYLAHTLATSASRIILANIFKIHNIPLHIIVGMLAGVILPLILFSISRKLKIEKFLYGSTIKSF